MIYDSPYFAIDRHVIYRWKALGQYLKNLKTGGAPLLEVRPYWGIYGISLEPIGLEIPKRQHIFSRKYLRCISRYTNTQFVYHKNQLKSNI